MIKHSGLITFEFCNKELFQAKSYTEGSEGYLTYFDVNFINNNGSASGVVIAPNGKSMIRFDRKYDITFFTYDLYKIIYWQEHYRQQEIQKIVNLLELICLKDDILYDETRISEFVSLTLDSLIGICIDTIDKNRDKGFDILHRTTSIIQALKEASNQTNHDIINPNYIFENINITQPMCEIIDFDFIKYLSAFELFVIRN